VAMQPEPAPTSARQRALILAAAGVGLLGLVLYVLAPQLSGRDELAAPSGLPGSAAGPTAGTGRSPETGAPGAVPSGSEPSVSTPPATSQPPIVAPATAKDPFHPLVGPPSGEGVTAVPGTPAGVAAPTGGSSTPSTVPGAAGGTATTPGGGSTTGRKVTLVDVLRRGGVAYADVEVDEKPYRVRKGQVFAGSYKTVDIGTSCAEFLSGVTAFTLCEGEAVLK